MENERTFVMIKPDGIQKAHLAIKIKKEGDVINYSWKKGEME